MRFTFLRLFAVAMLSAALSLLGEAHLHLCFDDLEAPATLHHVTDGTDHANHHSPGQGHSDSDVEFNTSLTKPQQNSADVTAIVVRVATRIGLARSTVLLRPATDGPSIRTAPRFSQPPLRAPPA